MNADSQIYLGTPEDPTDESAACVVDPTVTWLDHAQVPFLLWAAHQDSNVTLGAKTSFVYQVFPQWDGVNGDEPDALGLVQVDIGASPTAITNANDA